MVETSLIKGLIPGELWLEALCLRTGWTPDQVDAMPALFVERTVRLLQKQGVADAVNAQKWEPK